VPANLKVSDKNQTFTISVTYETLELYGKVNASRTFTIAPER
jgi:hypothetical protein